MESVFKWCENKPTGSALHVYWYLGYVSWFQIKVFEFLVLVIYQTTVSFEEHTFIIECVLVHHLVYLFHVVVINILGRGAVGAPGEAKLRLSRLHWMCQPGLESPVKAWMEKVCIVISSFHKQGGAKDQKLNNLPKETVPNSYGIYSA